MRVEPERLDRPPLAGAAASLRRALADASRGLVEREALVEIEATAALPLGAARD